MKKGTHIGRVYFYLRKNGDKAFTACQLTKKLFPESNRYKPASVLRDLHRLFERNMALRWQQPGQRGTLTWHFQVPI